jgi:hypothetical protein
MNRLRFYRIFVSLSFMVTLFAVQGLLHPVLAHSPTGGSKIRVNDEKVGPYNLLVATSPLPITVGQMSVWVRVSEEETGRLLRDATVMVEATPQGGGATLTAQATHEHAGNAFDYVAHLDIADSGQWDFIVYVQDEPGQVDVTFAETVTGGSNIILLVGLAASFVIVAVLVGVYLWRQSAAE